MAKKIVSRLKFSELAGVSPAAVTKACRGVLQPACVGKSIDVAHPSAVKYLEAKTEARREPAATGLDPLYEDAVALCQEQGRYSLRCIRENLPIADKRARAILDTMKANGVVPDKATQKQQAAQAPPLPKKTERKPRNVVNAGSEPEQLEDSGIVEIPEDIQQFADMTMRELIRRFGTDEAFVHWLNATQKIEMINEKRLKNAQTEGELIARDLVKRGVIDPIDGVFTKMLTDGVKTISSKVHAKVKAGGGVDDVKKVVEDQLSSFIRPVKVKMTRTLRDA